VLNGSCVKPRVGSIGQPIDWQMRGRKLMVIGRARWENEAISSFREYTENRKEM